MFRQRGKAKHVRFQPGLTHRAVLTATAPAISMPAT